MSEIIITNQSKENLLKYESPYIAELALNELIQSASEIQNESNNGYYS